MDKLEVCNLCGEGHVIAQNELVENEYKGQTKQLPQRFKFCAHCGSDFVGAVEAKFNKRAIIAWRKQVDGLLTGAEISDLRIQYGLTQGQAASLFGGGPVAFSKYENDDVAQSEAMDTLLRLVRASPEAFRALLEQKGMEAHMGQAVKSSKPTLTRVDTSHYRIERQREEPSPRYNPKEFRRWNDMAGGEICKG